MCLEIIVSNPTQLWAFISGIPCQGSRDGFAHNKISMGLPICVSGTSDTVRGNRGAEGIAAKRTRKSKRLGGTNCEFSVNSLSRRMSGGIEFKNGSPFCGFVAPGWCVVGHVEDARGRTGALWHALAHALAHGTCAHACMGGGGSIRARTHA